MKTPIYCLLFPGYQTLDLMGPVEILHRMSNSHLHYVSREGGQVASAQGFAVETVRLERLLPESVLLVPGGMATRTLVADRSYIATLADWATQSAWTLTVCTGSALLAATGLLDGLPATSNKTAFDWVRGVRPQVAWQGKARWVQSGKFYTASGVSAGMDMALGFIADREGVAQAESIAKRCEYRWQRDAAVDPFAVGV
ncbi:DJ-1/PfpI family protein [Cardiobacterium hominis]